MAIISVLYCFIIAAIGPLLLLMRWVQCKFQAITLANTSFVTRDLHLPRRPCANIIIPTPAHCNANLSKGERVQSLLDLLTVEEKISLLGHDSPSINRREVYLPEYKWWNEGLHGLAWTDCCPPHQWRNVTVFPQVIGLAMTWNRSLWNEVGGIIGAQAVHQRSSGGQLMPGLTYFTPNINIFRDPRWGRGQETPGEDPFLTSHHAAVMVLALQYGREFYEQLQNQSRGQPHLRIQPRLAATCKHWAAYSLEAGRFNFSAEIEQRDWDDTFTPAFQACIRAEQFLNEHFGRSVDVINPPGSLGVMCSYNAINGTPSCANREVLSKLRNDWGFKGYVVSDCWAIANIFENHHYASSYQEAVGMALRAGVDLDCGDTVQKYGLLALEENHMDIEDVDRALGNLFGTLIELGYFNEEDDTQNLIYDTAQKQFDDQVALEAALQSIVLLKNGPDDRISPRRLLPLSIKTHTKVTLIGPLADNEEVLLANYHGIPSRVITPLQGLKDMEVEVNYIQGCNVTSADDAIVTEDAICKQFSTDNRATIIIVGLDQTIESEEIDRVSLLLPKVQGDLITVAAKCHQFSNPGAPLILVVMSGGPVDILEYKINSSVDAILYTSYSGQAGGTALSEVLYGKYNPSGRLATTIYPNSYLNKVQMSDMRMRSNEREHYPGRTFRFLAVGEDVVYPFGYGLSYSSWNYTVEFNSKSVVAVNVSNTGSVDGSTSVLLFHMGPCESNGEPFKSLIGFDKVFVSAQNYRNVYMRLPRNVFSEPGCHFLAVGPTTDYTLQVCI